MDECDHQWEFQGVVYWYSDYSLAGSSDRERKLGDRYYCKRCLAQKTINERPYGTSFDNPVAGTMPR